MNLLGEKSICPVLDHARKILQRSLCTCMIELISEIVGYVQFLILDFYSALIFWQGIVLQISSFFFLSFSAFDSPTFKVVQIEILTIR